MVNVRLWRNAHYGTCACKKIGRWDIVINLLRPPPEVGGFFSDEISPANWIVRYSFPHSIAEDPNHFLHKKVRLQMDSLALLPTSS